MAMTGTIMAAVDNGLGETICRLVNIDPAALRHLLNAATVGLDGGLYNAPSFDVHQGAEAALEELREVVRDL